MAELYRFAAFVSYSSRDAAFARRLHRALESYRIPIALGRFDLVGGGGKRNRIFPVFRDREELPAGELGEAIEAALKASGALIVVCSPHAAASPWVDKEIASFLKLGRRDRIFAIIADDAPVEIDGRDATQACFPPAFRGDGLTSGDFEPIAADARKTKDGFRAAWLKIVAGLINVNAGALADRDRRWRRARRVRMASALAALAMAVLAAAALFATETWRNDLTTEAIRLATDGRTLDGLPFALAAVNVGGAILPALGDRAADALNRVSAVRVMLEVTNNAGFALSQDGRLLVTHASDGTAVMRDLHRDGTPVTLGKFPRGIAVSKNGAMLIAQNEDGTGTAYDLIRRGPPMHIGDLGGFRTLPMSEDGNIVALRKADGTAVVYDLGHGGAEIDLDQPRPIEELSLTRDGAKLIARDVDQLIAVYDLAHGGARRELGQIDGTLVKNAAWSRDGSMFVMPIAHRTSKLFDLRQGGRDIELGLSIGFQFSDDGAVLFGRTWDGDGAIYDVARRTSRELGPVNDTMLARNGAVLAVRRTGESAVTVYDLSPGGGERKLGDMDEVGRMGSEDDFRLSGDGEILFVRNKDSTGMVFDLKHGGAPINLGPARAWDMQLSQNGAALLIRRMNMTGAVYDLGHGGTAREISNLDHVVLSDDGAVLLAQDDKGTFVAYELSYRAAPASGAAASTQVCEASGSAIRPLPASARQPDPAVAASAVNARLHAALKGRPWHPCDWRSLTDGAEGLAQWRRMIGIRAFGAPDYACEERRADGTSDETARAWCARMRDVELVTQKAVKGYR